MSVRFYKAGEVTLHVGDRVIPVQALALEEDRQTNLPMCAVCGRPVRTLHLEDDFLRSTRRFIAECHGSREEVVITELEMYDMCRSGNYQFTFITAFRGEAERRQNLGLPMPGGGE